MFSMVAKPRAADTPSTMPSMGPWNLGFLKAPRLTAKYLPNSSPGPTKMNRKTMVSMSPLSGWSSLSPIISKIMAGMTQIAPRMKTLIISPIGSRMNRSL